MPSPAADGVVEALTNRTVTDPQRLRALRRAIPYDGRYGGRSKRRLVHRTPSGDVRVWTDAVPGSTNGAYSTEQLVGKLPYAAVKPYDWEKAAERVAEHEGHGQRHVPATLADFYKIEKQDDETLSFGFNANRGSGIDRLLHASKACFCVPVSSGRRLSRREDDNAPLPLPEAEMGDLPPDEDERVLDDSL